MMQRYGLPCTRFGCYGFPNIHMWIVHDVRISFCVCTELKIYVAGGNRRMLMWCGRTGRCHGLFERIYVARRTKNTTTDLRMISFTTGIRTYFLLNINETCSVLSAFLRVRRAISAGLKARCKTIEFLYRTR